MPTQKEIQDQLNEWQKGTGTQGPDWLIKAWHDAGASDAAAAAGPKPPAAPGAGPKPAATAGGGNSGSNVNTGGQVPGNYQGNGAGNDATKRTQNIYEQRGYTDSDSGEFKPTEEYGDWFSRAFRQSTRDNGGALNPYASENPFANTPYAKWFQGRFAQQIPQNMILERQLTGAGGDQAIAPWLEGGLKEAIAHGQGQGFGNGLAGASANLGGLRDQVEKMMRGDTSGLSAEQQGVASDVMNDPSSAMRFVNSQLQGQINPMALGYIKQQADSMQALGYDDQQGESPANKGAFLTNLLRKLNM